MPRKNDLKDFFKSLELDQGKLGWVLSVQRGRKQTLYHSEKLAPLAKVFRSAWTRQNDTAPWSAMIISRRGLPSQFEDWGTICGFFRVDDDKTVGSEIYGYNQLRKALKEEAAIEKLKQTTLQAADKSATDIELC